MMMMIFWRRLANKDPEIPTKDDRAGPRPPLNVVLLAVEFQ